MTKNDKNDLKWPDVKKMALKIMKWNCIKTMNYYVINDMIYAWPNSNYTFEEDWNLGNSQNSSTFEKFLIIKKTTLRLSKVFGEFHRFHFFQKISNFQKRLDNWEIPQMSGYLGNFPNS